MVSRYIGIRTEKRCYVWRANSEGRLSKLPPSRRTRRFPSDVWEWGYAGTGPAELAWALVRDAIGDLQIADLCCNAVRDAITGRLPREHWVLTVGQIVEAVESCIVDADPQDDEVIDLDLGQAVPPTDGKPAEYPDGLPTD